MEKRISPAFPAMDLKKYIKSQLLQHLSKKTLSSFFQKMATLKYLENSIDIPLYNALLTTPPAIAKPIPSFPRLLSTLVAISIFRREQM